MEWKRRSSQLNQFPAKEIAMAAMTINQTHQEAEAILDLLRPDEGDESRARRAIEIIEEHLDQIVTGWKDDLDALQEKLTWAEKDLEILGRDLTRMEEERDDLQKVVANLQEVVNGL
jgi:chromosome segregation ATPase